MSLRLLEPSLGEVPQKLRNLYQIDVERGGYKLICDIDEHVRGLKAALATERAKVKNQRLLITELRHQTQIVSVGGE